MRVGKQQITWLGIVAERRWLVIPVFLALALAIALAACAIAQKTVEITADGQTIALTTTRKTVKEVLDQAKIEVGLKDEVVPAPDQPLQKNTKINITRAVRVGITADGQTFYIYTVAKTVGEVLQQAGITPGSQDKISPAPEEPIAADAEIKVSRLREEITTKEVRVAFKTLRREDPGMELGETKVLQEGAEGLKEITYRYVYQDGKRIKREKVSEKTIKEPVNRVVAYGSTGMVSRGGKTYRFTRALTMTATGYTAGPESTGKYADGYTYTGLRATRGVVAVDPKVIPLGTRLYVEGYGPALAADIGGAIKGNKIDLCFDTVAEALVWGRRPVKVYVLAK